MNERNPARELLAIFNGWQPATLAGQGMTAARGWNDRESEDATVEHIRAWRCIADIRQTVAGLSALNIDMTSATSYLPRWGAMAAGVDVAWANSSGSGNAFPSAAMDQLRSLATIIDLAGAQMQPANLDLLGDVVQQVIELLSTDESLSGELRSYLVKLVREIRDALDDEKVGGGFDFADAAERLWVAMHAASAQSADSAPKWRDAAARLLPQAVVGVLTHMGAVGFDTVVQAIGS